MPIQRRSNPEPMRAGYAWSMNNGGLMKGLMLAAALLQAADALAENPPRSASIAQTCAESAAELPKLLRDLGGDVIEASHFRQEADAVIDESCRWTKKEGKLTRSVVLRPLRASVYEEDLGDRQARYLFGEDLERIMIRSERAADGNKHGLCEVLEEGELQLIRCSMEAKDVPSALRRSFDAALKHLHFKWLTVKAASGISLAELQRLR